MPSLLSCLTIVLPPQLSHCTCAHFDHGLRTLSPSLHACIWMRYLLSAERGGATMSEVVYRCHLAICSESRPLEAALSLKAAIHARLVAERQENNTNVRVSAKSLSDNASSSRLLSTKKETNRPTLFLKLSLPKSICS
jgi:hypothetical protein